MKRNSLHKLFSNFTISLILTGLIGSTVMPVRINAASTDTAQESSTDTVIVTTDDSDDTPKSTKDQNNGTSSTTDQQNTNVDTGSSASGQNTDSDAGSENTDKSSQSSNGEAGSTDQGSVDTSGDSADSVNNSDDTATDNSAADKNSDTSETNTDAGSEQSDAGKKTDSSETATETDSTSENEIDPLTDTTRIKDVNEVLPFDYGNAARLMPEDDPDAYGIRTQLIEKNGLDEAIVDAYQKDGYISVTDQDGNITKHRIMFYIDEKYYVTLWITNTTMDDLTAKNVWNAIDFENGSADGIKVDHVAFLDEMDDTVTYTAAAKDVIRKIALLKTDSTEEEIKAISDAYDALTEEEKATVFNYEKVLKPLLDKIGKTEEENRIKDQTAADSVIAMIDALTADSTAADLKAAKDAYDALTDSAKKLITTEEYQKLDTLLTSSENSKKEAETAQKVQDEIEALDDTSTEDAINTAEYDYNSLNDYQKTLVTNYSKLSDLLASIRKTDADTTDNNAGTAIDADKAAGEEVSSKIDALTNDSTREDIDAVNAAYNALNDAAKSYVSSDNVTKLNSLVSTKASSGSSTDGTLPDSGSTGTKDGASGTDGTTGGSSGTAGTTDGSSGNTGTTAGSGTAGTTGDSSGNTGDDSSSGENASDTSSAKDPDSNSDTATAGSESSGSTDTNVPESTPSEDSAPPETSEE